MWVDCTPFRESVGKYLLNLLGGVGFRGDCFVKNLFPPPKRFALFPEFSGGVTPMYNPPYAGILRRRLETPGGHHRDRMCGASPGQLIWKSGILM